MVATGLMQTSYPFLPRNADEIYRQPCWIEKNMLPAVHKLVRIDPLS
jgi:hypothetical protein